MFVWTEIATLIIGITAASLFLPSALVHAHRPRRCIVFYAVTFLPSLAFTIFYWRTDWMQPNPPVAHFFACFLCGVWIQELMYITLFFKPKMAIDYGIMFHHALCVLGFLELVYYKRIILFYYFWVLWFGGFFDFLGNMMPVVPRNVHSAYMGLLTIALIVGRIIMPLYEYVTYFDVMQSIISFHILFILNMVAVALVLIYGLEKSFMPVEN